MSANTNTKPKKRRIKKRIKKITKKQEFMNDIEKVMNVEPINSVNLTNNESQGSIEEDIKILNKAMEKLVVDVREMKTEIITLKHENQRLYNRVEELTHSVGADQNLHDWQVGTAEDKDVIETPITNNELIQKMNDYAGRRVQYGMD